ncbi:hypothetical protein [Leifsonia sp. TF02-11]|uniref:hypothetical protein n=1 Tax=Leifsonia sp. TF02-11 TaxID=2815212 RepID=UPI001AA1B7DE|nr:hypothetical protein [Leifsonia sp. TF02-11]MBO1739151.1 hypothetical protein [Leifsonia sp. TF02-11]
MTGTSRRRPSHRTWIIVGLSAAVVIAVGAFALGQVPVTAGRTTAADAPSSPGGQSGSGSGSASPGAGGTGSGGTATEPPVGKRYTTEVIPAQPTPTPALPSSTPLPYPVSAPLPASASATGKLVSGYPSGVLPQAPGSSIQSSSVSSQASHLQVSLQAKTGQGVTDIVTFYRAALAKYGMYDSPAPAQGGATSVRFERDGDSVTLTATPGDSGTSYVVFGTFTAKS